MSLAGKISAHILEQKKKKEDFSISNMLNCALPVNQETGGRLCPHAGIQLEHLDRHWQDGGGSGRGEDGETGQKLLFYLLSVHYFSQPCRDGVIHLEYANSWQRICLLVLDLPLGGRSPTQLLSLSSVCLKTPVIHPHSATLRQSHFSTSHPRPRLFGSSGAGARRSEPGGGVCVHHRASSLLRQSFR